MTAPAWLAGSTACAPLIDGPVVALRVAHRGRLAWQLADPAGRVVATLGRVGAIRLPCSLEVPALPAQPPPLAAGRGVLEWGGQSVRVSRWFPPRRPSAPALRPRVQPAPVRRLVAGWRTLLGQGDGLTPYGDDVLSAALVTLRAAGHPAGPAWAAAVADSALEQHTTATSAALLRAATRGWCIDPLADLLEALGRGLPTTDVAGRLRRVGHSSGLGLLAGVRTVLGPTVATA